MTKLIGLTGGIGSGKSTVINYIAAKGIPVYIADLEAKKIMQKPQVVREIVNAFGSHLVDDKGKINRGALAEIVFNDSEKLKKLNAIVHPKVKEHFKKWLKKHHQFKFVIKEVAILFETNGHLDCDKVILVTAPLEERIRRVIKRDKVSKEEVMARIKNQMPEEEKIKRSDFVIHNINLKSTFEAIDDMLTELETS